MDIPELSRLLENLIRVGTIHSVDHAAVRVRVQTGHLVTQWLPWFEHRAGETTTWDPPTIGEQCLVLSPSGVPEGGLVLIGIHSASIQPPSHSPNDHVTVFPDGTRLSYDHVAGVHKASYPDGTHLSYDHIGNLHKASYPDGASISYHHPSSHLEAVGIVTALVQASEKITFDTPLTHITGMCIVEDLLTYNNGLAGIGGANGSIINGLIRHEGRHEHEGDKEHIGLNTHVGEHQQSGGSLISNGIVVHTHVHEGVVPGGDNSGGPV